MDAIVAALADQHAELAALLDGLDPADWDRPTPCEGWVVSDVIIHLAQTDEMAVGSATGRYAEVVAALTEGLAMASSVDEGVDMMVDHERGVPVAELRDRWAAAAAQLVAALRTLDPSTRVPWVVGDLSARTMAATRLAESWIHSGDVATALGLALAPTDRLEPIARLAWRTLPYAFAIAGRELSGPVAFELEGPSGTPWSFVPNAPPVTTISGDAAELCAVAARRRDPKDTSLGGAGPDVEAVLALVRTYA
ncbi:MAG: wyosine base formation [Acidimicrobiales bacterium]|nr:wyosine base formation [Acidimicrobiales bacterium]